MKPEIEYVVVISNAEGALRFGIVRAISKGHAAFVMGTRHPNFVARYVTVEELEQ